MPRHAHSHEVNDMRRPICISLALLVCALGTAAPPPDRLNFEGVLRSASSAPLTGSYDMVFRLWGAATGGDEILVDSHTFASGTQVSVTGGLFNTELGGGVVTDGSGPGTYTTLTNLFRDYSLVYVSIQVGTESLSPRIKVSSAGHALNAEHASRLDSLDSGQLLRSDATDAFTSGTLSTAGGTTLDVNGALDLPATGITGAGAGSGLNADLVDGLSTASFLRSDANDTATGRITFAGDPIGPNTASGSVYVNPTMAAANETLLGVASNGSGAFKVDAEGDTEVQGNLAVGNNAGTSASIATNSRILISSGGDVYGVYGRAEDTSTNAGMVHGLYGNAVSSAYGKNSYGVYGSATTSWGGAGVYGTSNNIGVHGVGQYYGGFFEDSDSSADARVGYDTYKIQGTGSVAFAQNHPADRDRVIVYNSPEGDEVATYTRGSARLQAGVAHVALGETFAWVTNPDVGLTAHVTPREQGASLYVEHVTPTELVVRGDRDVAFDYIVHGLRIGFEEVTIVQEKRRESRIPSMADHRKAYAEHPELRRFNALERWRRMRAEAGDTTPLDLGGSTALRDAIEEFDPAVHASRIRAAQPGGGPPAPRTCRRRPGAPPPQPPRSAPPRGQSPGTGSPSCPPTRRAISTAGRCARDCRISRSTFPSPDRSTRAT